MLNEILSSLSGSLLSAREIPPIAPANARISRWTERACLSELRASLPAALPGDAQSLENHRRATLQHLTALVSNDAPCASIAKDVHALLCAAAWCDISRDDPYSYDPHIFDDSLAETACALAVMLNMLRASLSEISPALPVRIESELRRRVLSPIAEDGDLSALSLQGCCLTLCAVILGGVGESLRWPAIRRLCRAIDQQLNRLPADGSIPGGVETATDTAILLMDAMEILHIATRGKINLTGHERIACLADYPLFAHLQTGWFINPGERTMQPLLDAESLFRFGHRTSDSALCDLSAWLLRQDRHETAPHLLSRLLNRLTLRPLEETPGRIRLFRDGFLPDAGLMFMRGFHLHAAMTGATGTSHGDAGNICLFCREQPILIDLGGNHSATSLHSLPTIGGIGQRTNVPTIQTECGSGDENTTCHTVNLTAAYPEECHISDYQRTLLMGSHIAPGIRLMEMLELTQAAPVNFHFICACEPVLTDTGAKIGSVSLQWNGHLAPQIEALPGQRHFRLTLSAETAAQHHHIFEFTAMR